MSGAGNTVTFANDDAAGVGFIATLSEMVGTPEAAVRLLITIFAGYPIAALYRYAVMHQKSTYLQHAYFALCGMGLCFFNYGFDTYHSLIAVWITYLLARLLYHAPKYLIIINFAFHMSYLLIGYYFTASNDYDILWTMPHCVLVLRMIGFGFNVADGRKSREKLSKEQQENSLEHIPCLLALTAYAYFPCAFLIGPQFPYRRYKRFINGEYRQYSGAVEAGIKRMLIGVIYLVVRQVGITFLNDDYFLTDAFRNESFAMRLVYVGLWGKLSLYKYIACWLLTEGALMCLGFSYNGKTADGKDDWSGCTNVKLIHLETGTTMQDYVIAFNVNTNHWVAEYVYKRLKFLNNRTISYAAALGFLAVWHGFHSGYYMAFFVEFMTVTTEKQISSVYQKRIMPVYGHILDNSLPYKLLKEIILRAYNIVYMGWCLIPFIHLSFARYNRVFAAVNYFGFVYVTVWFIFYQVYKYQMRSAAKYRDEHAFSQAATLSPTVTDERKRE